MAVVTTVTLNPAVDHYVFLDALELSAVNRAREERVIPGGKGVNVACYLAAFELPVRVTGLLGQDDAGPFERRFRELAVEDAFLRVPGAVRRNFKLVVDSQVTEVNLAGEGGRARRSMVLDHVERVADSAWVVLAGSLPPGFGEDAYADAIERIGGHRVILDASGEALARALQAGPAMVKPNRKEAEQLLGRSLPDETSAIRAAREIHERWSVDVALSLGPDGAIFALGDRLMHAVAPDPPDIQSQVGAGDALVAGYVAGLVAGLDPLDRSRLASAFAVSSTRRAGAWLPAKQDIEATATRVEVREL